MGKIEILGGIVLALACLLITIVVLIQESKDPGMSAAIGGGSNESFYGKNSSRTKNAKVQKLTTISAVLLFIVTMVVNFLTIKN